jgi:hypothetical protein
LRRLCWHPLPTAGSRICAARYEKRDKILYLTFCQNTFEGWHTVSPFEYLGLNLRRPATLADTPQIGRPISADASNAMAALASLGMEYACAALVSILTRRIYR